MAEYLLIHHGLGPSFVLLRQGRHNKVLQTRWFKTPENYCPIVLETRSPRSWCHLGWFLFGISQGDSVPCHILVSGPCQQSLAFLGLWVHYSACRFVTLLSAFLFIHMAFLCLRVSSRGHLPSVPLVPYYRDPSQMKEGPILF